jgi:hypothetical protein
VSHKSSSDMWGSIRIYRTQFSLGEALCRKPQLRLRHRHHHPPPLRQLSHSLRRNMSPQANESELNELFPDPKPFRSLDLPDSLPLPGATEESTAALRETLKENHQLWHTFFNERGFHKLGLRIKSPRPSRPDFYYFIYQSYRTRPSGIMVSRCRC